MQGLLDRRGREVRPVNWGPAGQRGRGANRDQQAPPDSAERLAPAARRVRRGQQDRRGRWETRASGATEGSRARGDERVSG